MILARGIHGMNGAFVDPSLKWLKVQRLAKQLNMIELI